MPPFCDKCESRHSRDEGCRPVPRKRKTPNGGNKMRISKARFKQMEQDIKDMMAWHLFSRCPHCHRLSAKGYCCGNCGYDGTPSRTPGHAGKEDSK